MTTQPAESSGSVARLRRLLRLRWALSLVWRAAPRWASASVALVLLQGLVPLLHLLLLKEVVDSIAAVTAAPDPMAALHRPLVLVGLVGVLGVAGAALQAAGGWVSEALGLRLTDHVQGLIHERSVRLDLAYFETPEYHDHLHRAQRQGGHRPARILTGLTQLAQGVLASTAVAGLLILFEPWIALALGAAAVPGLVIRVRHSRRLFRWWGVRTATERLALVYDWMITHVVFAKEVRLFDLGRHLTARHRELREALRRERLALARRRAVGDVVAQAGAALAVFACLFVIVLRVGRGAATIGGLVMYYQALQRLLGYAQQVLASLAGLYEDSLFLEHLEEFLSQRPRIVEPDDPRPLRLPLREGVVFESVTYSYPGSDGPALQDVSLRIRAGEITALVGENGAGKTTVARLMCRLYDPDEGRVLLDGVDLRAFRLADLRLALAVVFQDFAHFPVSLRENVGFGDVAHLEDLRRIEEAAARAGADKVVAGLPKGYETPLGKWFEGGRELSAGQWQKLALARAYFRDAPIVVLDEPTAALDALAEAELHARLRALGQGRTTLLISHRFSSISMADRIVVLRQGRVVEEGTHDTLMRRAGVYASLYTAQAGLYHRG